MIDRTRLDDSVRLLHQLFIDTPQALVP